VGKFQKQDLIFFNDFHQIAGISALRNQIENSIHIVEKHHVIEID
jgi:hypothetical protein